MSERNKSSSGLKAFARRHPRALLALGVASAFALYLAGVPHNPPGFFVDESSIAYNAHLIARTGADEHGAAWPLYFRAFGEYKSPVYIYLLAALYKLAGPSIAVARGLSGVAGASAALVLGLVAARSLRSVDDDNDAAHHVVGFAVTISALLTPWLFETSRLVFEVALMPLALALLLLALVRAYERGPWLWRDSLAVAAALALITYTYSVGRLAAPLLALGLVLFARRGGWLRAVGRTWLLYAVSLVPFIVFTLRNPRALGERFAQVSFIRPEMTWGEVALRFLQNYAGSFNPWSWLVAGDPEPRHHVQTMGSLLVPVVVAAAIGLFVLLRRRGGSAWWRFVVYGLLVSALPSALTIDHFHTLRLIGVPVFLLLLTAPAFAWLLERGTRARWPRVVFAVLILATLLQGALFQWHFRRESPRRWHSFDAHYTEVFDAAMSRPERPIHLIDNVGAPGYMHAYWYATLRGADPAREFVRLPKEARPPTGALVISTELPCTRCRIISERAGFRAYIAE